MSNKYRLCHVNELKEGEARGYVVNGNDVLLVRLSDGYHALDNVCSHEHAYLSDGDVIGDKYIECWRHGSRFDIRTGKPVNLPAVLPVAKYQVLIENDEVYVVL